MLKHLGCFRLLSLFFILNITGSCEGKCSLRNDALLNFYQFSCLSSRERDVAAIDVNMGCPKEYSTKVTFKSFPSGQYLASRLSVMAGLSSVYCPIFCSVCNNIIRMV